MVQAVNDGANAVHSIIILLKSLSSASLIIWIAWPTSPPRLSRPFIRFLPSADVKPHQATLRRQPPWKSFEGFQWAVHDSAVFWVRALIAHSDVIWFVTEIPSIFIDVTCWMSVSGGGGQTVHRRRFSVTIIFRDFLRFIFRLLLAATSLILRRCISKCNF